jgi:hypothetical protein
MVSLQVFLWFFIKPILPEGSTLISDNLCVHTEDEIA